jgi:hypothetical protein|tara:strand:- start:108 stop:1016 length:909 start_codon:yes stop_codon:yes gene_type:complete
VALKDTFKEPTILRLFFASILAIFEFLNSFGLLDNVAEYFELYAGADGDFEKLIIIPSGFSIEFWGVLEPSLQDYVIVAFLVHTLFSLWVNRPIEQKPNQQKRRRLLVIKSTRWLRGSILFLLIAVISTANKKGAFAKAYENVTGKVSEGEFWIVDGSWGFHLMEWGFTDYFQLSVLYSLFFFGIWKGIGIDKSSLDILSDKRIAIEKVWDNLYYGEREARVDVDVGAAKVNEAFTDLVNMLNVATNLNVAAASLDQGNVKGAFNKWKNLTHRKGKLHSHWRGFSTSLDLMGNFDQDIEEEE